MQHTREQLSMTGFSGWIDHLMGTKNCMSRTVGCVDVYNIHQSLRANIYFSSSSSFAPAIE